MVLKGTVYGLVQEVEMLLLKRDQEGHRGIHTG